MVIIKILIARNCAGGAAGAVLARTFNGRKKDGRRDERTLRVGVQATVVIRNERELLFGIPQRGSDE